MVIPECAHRVLCDWARRVRPRLPRFTVSRPQLGHNVLQELDNWDEIDQLSLLEPEVLIEYQLKEIAKTLNRPSRPSLEVLQDKTKVAPKKKPPLPAVPVCLPEDIENEEPCAQLPNAVIPKAEVCENAIEDYNSRLDAMLETHTSKKRAREQMAVTMGPVRENKQYEPDPKKIREEDSRKRAALLLEKERLTKLLSRFGDKDVSSWLKERREEGARKIEEERRKKEEEAWQRRFEENEEKRRNEEDAARRKPKKDMDALFGILNTEFSSTRMEDNAIISKSSLPSTKKEDTEIISEIDKTEAPNSRRMNLMFNVLGDDSDNETEQVIEKSRQVSNRIESLLSELADGLGDDSDE